MFEFSSNVKARWGLVLAGAPLADAVVIASVGQAVCAVAAAYNATSTLPGAATLDNNMPLTDDSLRVAEGCRSGDAGQYCGLTGRVLPEGSKFCRLDEAPSTASGKFSDPKTTPDKIMPAAVNGNSSMVCAPAAANGNSSMVCAPQGLDDDDGAICPVSPPGSDVQIYLPILFDRQEYPVHEVATIAPESSHPITVLGGAGIALLGKIFESRAPRRDRITCSYDFSRLAWLDTSGHMIHKTDNFLQISHLLNQAWAGKPGSKKQVLKEIWFRKNDSGPWEEPHQDQLSGVAHLKGGPYSSTALIHDENFGQELEREVTMMCENNPECCYSLSRSQPGLEDSVLRSDDVYFCPEGNMCIAPHGIYHVPPERTNRTQLFFHSERIHYETLVLSVTSHYDHFKEGLNPYSLPDTDEYGRYDRHPYGTPSAALAIIRRQHDGELADSESGDLEIYEPSQGLRDWLKQIRGIQVSVRVRPTRRLGGTSTVVGMSKPNVEVFLRANRVGEEGTLLKKYQALTIVKSGQNLQLKGFVIETNQMAPWSVDYVGQFGYGKWEIVELPRLGKEFQSGDVSRVRAMIVGENEFIAETRFIVRVPVDIDDDII